MYVDLVQYPHLVSSVMASLDALPSLIVPNLAPQEVPLPIQDEHGYAMEDCEWAHKDSRWCYKVDACTNYYAPKWALGAYTFPLNASQEIRASIYSSWGA
jgi:hypothetical protein